MGNEIESCHNALLKTMGIPKWMLLKCPYCKADLPLTSIRTVGFKLNTRNVGDIFVEVLCNSCKRMDTLYFRQEISKVTDFIGFLTGDKTPINAPVLESDMYSANYNNLLENPLYRQARETQKGSDKMTMIKKGTCSSKILVSSSVYVCSLCEYTEIVKDSEISDKKLCPKCKAEMLFVSASVAAE